MEKSDPLLLDEHPLDEHVFSTYITLRFGMAVLALAFPLLLFGIGKLRYGINLEPSMSHYFFSAARVGDASFPMRTWFVGLLFAIGAFLYLYKGFSDEENIALNLAGAAAVGVAVFPMAVPGTPLEGWSLSIHGFAAVFLFLCLAWVALRAADDTLVHLPPAHQHKEDKLRKAYRAIGLTMVAAPAIAVVLNALIGGGTRFVFFIEACGIWAFSAYWWLKSYEMSLSRAEKRALEGRI